jgi:hypothetical protein
MPTGLPRSAYQQVVEEVHAGIRTHVPAGAVVLIVSKGDEGLVRIEGYRAWHFPRDEWGAYAGHHPGTSVEAIAHLRHLYGQGARFLVFPSTAAWWLEHYRELADFLDSAHRLVFSREGAYVIYELRESAAFDAYASEQGDAEWAADQHAQVETTELLRLTAPTAGRPMRVLTILARFGSEQYRRAEEDIAALFARRLNGIDRDVIVVDNALPRDFVDSHRGSVLLGGDNSSREFSAFDRAVDHVGGGIWSYDFVHCATSAFSALYADYLERFEPAVLQVLAGRPACVGHIDCYNEAIEVRTWRAQHWMRSCFFLLPPAEVMALGRFVSVADGTPFFSGDPHNPFRTDAPISPRYRDYIVRWLTGDGVGQGVRWHSRFALTRDTLQAFEEKARAILNEQLLSIRLEALGCHLIDVTWLSTMMRRGTAQPIPLTISWREQLANRDRDAVVPTSFDAEPIRGALSPLA